MAENHADQEQIESLKRWWRDNQTQVLTGLVLGVAIVGGWRWWQNFETTRAEEASALHAELAAATTAKDQERIDALFARLKTDYAKTPYAVQGALLAAQAAVERADLAAARSALEWAGTRAQDAELDHIVSLRLARVRLAQGEAEAALTSLARVPAGEFEALAQDLRGDAELAAGRPEAARTAWQAALAALDEGADRTLIEMKLAQLPVAPPAGTP